MKGTITKSGAERKTRPGGSELAGRKIIKCPHCREVFMDLDKTEKVELFCIPAGKRKPVNCEKIKPCKFCGGRVGYNMTPAAETRQQHSVP